jgi:hypothetical protein
MPGSDPALPYRSAPYSQVTKLNIKNLQKNFIKALILAPGPESNLAQMIGLT